MSIVHILRNFVTTFYLLLDADPIHAVFYRRSIRTLIRIFNYACEIVVKKNATERPDMNKSLFDLCMDRFVNETKLYDVPFFTELNEVCGDVALAKDAVDLYNATCDELETNPRLHRGVKRLINRFIN
jgi:hypothetical protein